ncbi:MAG: chemotaxis protein CheW [Gammaproteobacteria bacterium]|nr:chemotaxis protein CheW [Gammaproteobacteria bacterium]
MEQSAVAQTDSIETVINGEDVGENTRKYLSFMVDGDIYAFNALAIKEIIEYANITKIPMVPNFIRGVTNLRGSVVPVVDLSSRIGKRVAPISKRTCIVIVETMCDDEMIVVGVVIDAINEVFNLREQEIEAAPSFGAGIRADFLSGMGKVGGKFVVLLNIDKVLSVSELSDLIGKSSLQFDKVSFSQASSSESLTAKNDGDDADTSVEDDKH